MYTADTQYSASLFGRCTCINPLVIQNLLLDLHAVIARCLPRSCRDTAEEFAPQPRFVDSQRLEHRFRFDRIDSLRTNWYILVQPPPIHDRTLLTK